jgi:hypothetical protein
MPTQERSARAATSDKKEIDTNRAASARSSTSVTVCAVAGEGSDIAARESGSRFVTNSAAARRSPATMSHRILPPALDSRTTVQRNCEAKKWHQEQDLDKLLSDDDLAVGVVERLDVLASLSSGRQRDHRTADEQPDHECDAPLSTATHEVTDSECSRCPAVLASGVTDPRSG